MSKIRCPGSLSTTVPTPTERKCHKCGALVEIWSDEEKTDCKCGTTVFKDKQPTCAIWCSYAEKCLGDVVDVKKIKEDAKKVAATEGNPEFFDNVSKLISEKKKQCGK